MNEYYRQQAGSGIGGFSGVRYQRGHGFFGRLISGGIGPILKKIFPYVKNLAMDTGLNIAEDVLDGNNLKESAKRRFKESGINMVKDGITQVKKMKGSGYKRRKKRSAPIKRTKRKFKRKGKRKTRRKYKRRTRKLKAINFL